MCAHLLETAESTADHTTVNLAAGLEDMLTHWKLPISCFGGTTTENITLVLESIEFFAHIIQISIKKQWRYQK